MLDVDDDCAATLGPALLARANAARPDRRIGVALAVREYEAWLIASLRTLRGHRRIAPDAEEVDDPEQLTSPKSRMNELCGGYSETIDQPALTARIDVALTRSRAPSFDKLVRVLVDLLT